MKELKVHVLLRASKKTGKVDTCMTGLGSGLLTMWGLQNTTKTKRTLVIERDTGKVVAAYEGTESGWPKINKGDDLGYCDAYGIAREDLLQIQDDRFDKAL